MPKKIEIKSESFKDKEKQLKQKLNMFDKLGDCCLTCKKPFDKKDKEQVKTWFVVVKNAENSVNTYCPDCWGKATALVQQIMNGENND